MQDDKYPLRRWAIRNVNDRALRTRIIKDIDEAWAKKNIKAQKVYQFFYQMGQYENLPNAVQSVVVKYRTRTNMSERHSCHLCSTRHADGYRCSMRQGKDRDDTGFFVGNICARKRLIPYGLNAAIIADADTRGAEKKQATLHDDLTDLVQKDGLPVLLLAAHKPKKKREAFIGAQLNWLRDYGHKHELDAEVSAALKNMTDKYYRPAPREIRLVLDTIALLRPNPAEAFEDIAQDIVLMEQEQLAPLGLARDLKSLHDPTAKEIDALVQKSKEYYLDYRIRKNALALQQYEPAGKSLATILDDIIPSLEHDKPLWHEDHARKRYEYNKVLTRKDYNLVKKCLWRWAFGATQHLDRIDRLKLRNVAIRIEPVKAFERILEDLVVLSRKLDYGRSHVQNEEYQRLKTIQHQIELLPPKKRYREFKKAALKIAQELKDPCLLLKTQCIPAERFAREYGTTLDAALTSITNAYTRDARITRFQNNTLPKILDHALHGILRKSDAAKIAALYSRVKNYGPIGKQTNKMEREILELVSELAKSGLVQKIAGFPALERFKDNLFIDPAVLKGVDEKKRHGALEYVKSAIDKGLAELPYQGTPQERVSKAVAYIDERVSEGYRVVEIFGPEPIKHAGKLPSYYEQHPSPVYENKPTKQSNDKHRVYYLDPQTVARVYLRFAQGIPVGSARFQQTWKHVMEADAAGRLTRRQLVRGSYCTKNLLPESAKKTVETLLSWPAHVQERTLIPKSIMTELEQYAAKRTS
jgi:hypothetical protein